MEKRKTNLSWRERAQRLLGVLLLGLLFTVALYSSVPVCGAEEKCSANFKAGEPVTLFADPYPGCKFVKWTCDIQPCPCEGQGRVCTFIMPPYKLHIDAEFKKLIKPTWRRGM